MVYLNMSVPLAFPKRTCGKSNFGTLSSPTFFPVNKLFEIAFRIFRTLKIALFVSADVCGRLRG